MKTFSYFLIKIKRCYKIIVLPFLLLFFFSFKTVQKYEEINRRIDEVRDAFDKNTYPTDKCIKIMLECYNDSKKINYKKGIKRSGLSLMLLYISKFDYNNVIKISNEIESIIEENGDYKDIVKYHLSRGECLIAIGLHNEGYREYLVAMNFVEKIINNDYKHNNKSNIYLHIANYHVQTVKADEDSIVYYTKKALLEGEKISDSGDLSKTGKKNNWLISLNLNLGNFYLTCQSPDMNLSRAYYEKARYLYETSKTKMLLVNEIQLLSYLSQFYYHDKNYKESIHFGLKSLELQKKENDPYSKKVVYESMARSYLELEKKEEYQKYMNKYVVLTDSMTIYGKLAASESLKTIVKKKEDDNQKKNSLIFYTSGGIILMISVCFLLFWGYRNKKIHSNYLTVIEKLKSEKEIETTNTELDSKEKSNTFNIPEETYHKILAKMEKFEKNLGFLKNDITLSYLSNQFKTNPKSLSSVIKSNTDKNFNTYINDLRINYIIHKLYENKQYREFKINYLAEECGFSSPKVFVTAFKKLTGVTPSYYITNLKKDV